MVLISGCLSNQMLPVSCFASATISLKIDGVGMGGARDTGPSRAHTNNQAPQIAPTSHNL